MATFDELFASGDYEEAFRVADNPLDRFYASVKAGNEEEALFQAGEAYSKNPHNLYTDDAMETMYQLIKYRDQQAPPVTPPVAPPAPPVTPDEGQYNLDINVTPGAVLHAKPQQVDATDSLNLYMQQRQSQIDEKKRLQDEMNSRRIKQIQQEPWREVGRTPESAAKEQQMRAQLYAELERERRDRKR